MRCPKCGQEGMSVHYCKTKIVSGTVAMQVFCPAIRYCNSACPDGEHLHYACCCGYSDTGACAENCRILSKDEVEWLFKRASIPEGRYYPDQDVPTKAELLGKLNTYAAELAAEHVRLENATTRANAYDEALTRAMRETDKQECLIRTLINVALRLPWPWNLGSGDIRPKQPGPGFIARRMDDSQEFPDIRSAMLWILSQ